MIKFSLLCGNGHEFECWFQSGAAYEAQTSRAQVVCPQCGSHVVDKAIMAPSVAKQGAGEPEEAAEPPHKAPLQEIHALLRKVRDEVHAKGEYVGGRFAEEARRIHFQESPARGIYGEASPDDVKGLADDGIPFVPMPRLPEDLN